MWKYVEWMWMERMDKVSFRGGHYKLPYYCPTWESHKVVIQRFILYLWDCHGSCEPRNDSKQSAFPNIFDDILYRVAEGGIVFDVLFDLLDGVDDGGVVTVAELFTDAFHR